MIWLILCILISVAILALFRTFPRFEIHRDNTIVISYLFSFTFSFFYRENDIELIALSQQNWFYLALIIGFTFYIGFQLFARSTQKIGMAITSVSGNTSVVIPVTIAFLFYGEAATLPRLVGIGLVIASFFLIFKKDKAEKADLNFIYLPILLFFMNGVNASLMAYSEKIGASEHMMNFMMLIFLAAFFVGTIIVAAGKNKEKIRLKTLVASLALGTLNFLSTIMIFKSLETLADSIFFPVYNSGYIVLAALFGFWVFREKLLAINWIGIGIALGGIIILSSGI
jgi:drug/metabolite transporter (DMT)-like permease